MRKLYWWIITFRGYKVLVCKYWEDNGMRFKSALERASQTTRKGWKWLKDKEKKNTYQDGTKPQIGDIFEYQVSPESSAHYDNQPYMQQCKVIYWDDVHDLGAEVLNGHWIGMKLMPSWNNIIPIKRRTNGKESN